MRRKKCDEVVRLGLGHADDVPHETRVEEQSFPSGHWVGTHKRVLGLYGVASDCVARATSTLRLVYCRVDRGETLQVGSKRVRKSVISSES